jgi:uncharacterized protein
MKSIAVFSDLHIPTRLDGFPLDRILPFMNNIDIIFGLGDYVNQKALDNLYSFGKTVHCVSGNMDDNIIKSIIPSKLTVTVEDVNIGLIHGWGGSFRIQEKISREFNNIDLICYGHTHEPFSGEINNIKFFNPGSICGNKSSFGKIDIDGKKIKFEIINLYQLI